MVPPSAAGGEFPSSSTGNNAHPRPLSHTPLLTEMIDTPSRPRIVDRRQVTPDWLPKIEKGPRQEPEPLLTWTFWSGRPDLNRRPLDPQARIRRLTRSESVEREPYTCSDSPAGSRSMEENLRALAPLVGSQGAWRYVTLSSTHLARLFAPCSLIRGRRCRSVRG